MTGNSTVVSAVLPGSISVQIGLAAMQMIDVHLPTTDRRELVLTLQQAWEIDPDYLALRAKTLDIGLRSIGFPDE
jgi:hypothetical protein